MHQIFDVWDFIVRTKTCAHYFCFGHQNKTLKKSSKIIIFFQKISFFPQDFQIFVLPFSSLFPFLVISDFIEEVDWWHVLKFMLWHHHVTKLDFKKAQIFQYLVKWSSDRDTLSWTNLAVSRPNLVLYIGREAVSLTRC